MNMLFIHNIEIKGKSEKAFHYFSIYAINIEILKQVQNDEKIGFYRYC